MADALILGWILGLEHKFRRELLPEKVASAHSELLPKSSKRWTV